MIQVGGINNGAAFTAINRKNIPKYEYSLIISNISAIQKYILLASKTLLTVYEKMNQRCKILKSKR